MVAIFYIIAANFPAILQTVAFHILTEIAGIIVGVTKIAFIVMFAAIC
jgi:hypothetical protein